VHLKLFRAGETRDVTVTLDENTEKNAASNQGGQVGGAALQGVQVQNLTPSLARELGSAPTTEGVVIVSVDPSSAAATTGLQRGDVILEVNRKPVHNVNEYNQALAWTSKQPVLLLINRGGTTHFVVIRPE